MCQEIAEETGLPVETVEAVNEAMKRYIIRKEQMETEAMNEAINKNLRDLATAQNEEQAKAAMERLRGIGVVGFMSVPMEDSE